MSATAPRERGSILLPKERIGQLKELAALEGCTATEYLEELIRVRSRKQGIGLPGFTIGHVEGGNLLIAFEQPSFFPLTELTVEEARRIARDIRALLKGGPRVRPTFETDTGHLIEVYRQAKGIVLCRYTDQAKGKQYKKSFTESVARDVVDWLEAGADRVEATQ
ncbi:hypothetical protein A3709_16745 [Halioglobus sp. HI00S01]|uniref:hypothetical protein n=1 Tax=Halioglobus sp. HI00S01 TaxID=1822214 RepID=UPI0007C35026|nr:hypothetical protein [Halioglobus sp. HI00S01]KZX59190.1 hypothetical protein A3709_16745 [Halioglobus sp. HI00S01]